MVFENVYLTALWQHRVQEQGYYFERALFLRALQAIVADFPPGWKQLPNFHNIAGEGINELICIWLK